MAPRRQIATKAEYVGTLIMVVLCTASALLHAGTTARVWLAGAKPEVYHWGPIVSMSLFAVWGLAALRRYHRAPAPPPSERTRPAIWTPRER